MDDDGGFPVRSRPCPCPRPRPRPRPRVLELAETLARPLALTFAMIG